MAKDAVKKIVKAAESWKNVRPASANHPYFSYCEEKEWGRTTSFLRTKLTSEKKISNI
jgi:hypothetical protein